jgi:hypothetical protein
VLFRTGVGDTHCGMRGFRRDALDRLGLQMPGMELASELVIKNAMAGHRVEEIPITLWPDGRNRPPCASIPKCSIEQRRLTARATSFLMMP